MKQAQIFVLRHHRAVFCLFVCFFFCCFFFFFFFFGGGVWGLFFFCFFFLFCFVLFFQRLIQRYSFKIDNVSTLLMKTKILIKRY